MKVTVQYFAVLREQAGLDQEEVLTSAATYRGLYDELSERHGFRLSDSLVKVAEDTEFASMDAPVRDGATIVFIPPVAGG